MRGSLIDSNIVNCLNDIYQMLDIAKKKNEKKSDCHMSHVTKAHEHCKCKYHQNRKVVVEV
jgi:hypothetical protein